MNFTVKMLIPKVQKNFVCGAMYAMVEFNLSILYGKNNLLPSFGFYLLIFFFVRSNFRVSASGKVHAKLLIQQLPQIEIIYFLFIEMRSRLS